MAEEDRSHRAQESPARPLTQPEETAPHHRTHKGWCFSVCSLLQYFCRNFSALSAASMDSGWLATARFTTCQQQRGQISSALHLDKPEGRHRLAGLCTAVLEHTCTAKTSLYGNNGDGPV